MVTKDECPGCHNKEKDKIVLHKDRDEVKIYKCLSCEFKWAVWVEKVK